MKDDDNTVPTTETPPATPAAFNLAQYIAGRRQVLLQERDKAVRFVEQCNGQLALLGDLERTMQTAGEA